MLQQADGMHSYKGQKCRWLGCRVDDRTTSVLQSWHYTMLPVPQQPCLSECTHDRLKNTDDRPHMEACVDPSALAARRQCSETVPILVSIPGPCRILPVDHSIRAAIGLSCDVRKTL